VNELYHKEVQLIVTGCPVKGQCVILAGYSFKPAGGRAVSENSSCHNIPYFYSLIKSGIIHNYNHDAFSEGGYMKYLKIFFALLVLLLFGVSAHAEVKHKKFTREEIKKMAETKAAIETKFGTIELKFFPEVAPNHVDNFIQLAKKGFYDGTTFHRIIPGFMIQGGDPNSRDTDRSKHGMGDPGYKLKAEFNDRPHKKGTLSMARSRNPDSAGSQFFICVADTPWLDRQYTVFGEVTSGIEVADEIVKQPKDGRDNPNERIEMKVRIVEK